MTDKENKSINDKELLEILADIEHTRWSNWQSYLHSLCIKNEDGSLTIPKERVDWWNKEITTPYQDLDEHLKQYDRDEVINTLNAINNYLIMDKVNKSAREMAIENNYEYRERLKEINIDKIIDEDDNIAFYMCVDKIDKSISIHFDKEEFCFGKSITLTEFDIKLMIKIREELGWD